jgi:hypothetical protein
MHRYLLTFVAGFAAAAALLLTLAAVAQTDLRGHMLPAVIDIRQSVPVVAEIDGASVPVTVDLSLQVSLSGPVTVAVADASPPVVTVSAPGTGAPPLDYEEIARYTDDHIGKTYAFRAKVWDAYRDGKKLLVQVDSAGPHPGTAIVWRTDEHARILGGDIIDVVGTVRGRDNVSDNSPSFDALTIEIVPQ